ncbi:RNA polymerase sigma factor [Paenibacillus uliginis]|uniref:RNA polymerase sigma factor n=1 Tax=Paenibacillus uliginis TaxID=683737 RepID=UPI001AD8455C|nr:sigma factor-like helix-turn-helix DNA-binding protein [Paenibacillus uliginis]
MSRLPEQYRTILLLREMNGLSYRELGEFLDISLDQVKVTLYRARERFNTELKQEEGEL